MPSPGTTRQSGQSVGSYRLLRRIGAGGMGEVWEVHDERLDRTVALKLLTPEQNPNPNTAARMLQEGRALALLDHPSIVRVFHCDCLDPTGVYLALELVDGDSMRDWLGRKGGRIDWPMAIALGQQIATAMAYVHHRNIVHRDLKPENILMVSAGQPSSELVVKIIDFGIAKVPAASHLVHTQVQTATAVLLGSVLYMAPEQCRNAAQVTGAADVYALGVLLFEAIAGRPPFVGEPAEVLAHHLSTPSPPLGDWVNDAPAALCALVASMLDKDPANRPSMQRISTLLSAGFAGQVPESCPLPGLMPFSTHQAEWFFGRQEERHELSSLWQRALHGELRWIQLEGPSGVGKTSLVQAGLLPHLLTAPDAPDVLVVAFRPGGDPVERLRASFQAALTQRSIAVQTEALDAALDASSGAFADFAASHLPADTLLLVCIEQLEELFTLGNAEPFDALMTSWLSDPASRVRVLSTFRSDFLHRIEQLPGLAKMLNRAARYHLRAMDNPSLVQAAEGMAQRSGLRLATGLADQMVQDAGQSDARLSLIGHALQTLWLSRDGSSVSLASYERMQGVVGALTAQVERMLDELGPSGRERAKWIVLGLIQPGQGSPDTRRPRMCSDLLRLAGADREAESAILLLAGLSGQGVRPPLRLIALHGAPGTPLHQQQAELVHEMLITQVPAISRWLEEERVLLGRCSDLEGAAAAWERAGRPSQGLPAGTLLTHLAGPPTKKRVIRRMMSERAISFLATARQLDSQRRWISRIIVAALMLAAIVSTLSARHARQKERAAEESSNRLAAAVRQVATDTDWELARMPGTLSARRDLLSVLIRELDGLPDEARMSTDAATALVDAYHRRGDLALSNETVAAAGAHFSRAQALLTQLTSKRPVSDELKRLTALNLSKRGKVALARGELDSAHRLFVDSVTILESLTARDSSEESIRCLAVSYGELASLLTLKGEHTNAAKLYTQAAGVLAKNSGTYDKWLLALNQRDAAELALEVGSLSEAMRLVAQARAIIEAERSASTSSNLFADSVVAKILSTEGELAARQGSRSQAVELLAAAAATWDRLLLADPTNKGSAFGLAQSLARNEALAAAGGDQARALGLRDQRCRLVAGSLAADPEDSRFHRLACKK